MPNVQRVWEDTEGDVMVDNLQEIADEMREEVRTRGYCFREIVHAQLAHPLSVDLIPDGINWIVRVRCGERMISDTFATRDTILNEMYAFLRACIKLAAAPPSKPS